MNFDVECSKNALCYFSRAYTLSFIFKSVSMINSCIYAATGLVTSDRSEEMRPLSFAINHFTYKCRVRAMERE